MPRSLTRLLTVLAVVLGAYLVGRAAVEPFVVDLGDPSTYRQDWGGPSLAGVLAVHMGPGVAALVAFVAVAVRRLRRGSRGTIRA